MTDFSISPSHAAIKTYLDEVNRFDTRGVTLESTRRTAFFTLVTTLARAKNRSWNFDAESRAEGIARVVRPDGTLLNEHSVPVGHWEAKDLQDDLETEIAKKRARGYPFYNIIFEDTRRAVLFQNKQEVGDYDLTQPAEIARLLERFLNYTSPQIDAFNRAVDVFKERTPDLARGLKTRIDAAHKDNKAFQQAFADFFELCKTALNPNIRREAVDEMIIQHLLTERLMRNVFDNPDFARRNVIAGEVEKVIDALTRRDFSRDAYLRQLDDFYVAIEGVAASVTDFREKQRFINTVYERFFQGYAVDVADTHGIVYTPQPIVDFMCAAVEEVLHDEFNKTLYDRDVYLIDPCTGTGNFIINLLHRIYQQNPAMLADAYKHRLFANEVMLMPYYVAALNIEHTYYELMQEYAPFEGLCFVDTLALAEAQQKDMFKVTEANTARVQRQQDAPLTVIIGNPPYNVGQVNENDNNKNRKYPVIDQRLRDTYAKDSKATNKNALSDAYVKFFRWAADRLQGRDGIVCYVSNNGFVDGVSFDGMRQHLLQDFSQIYHLDLAGNARTSGERRRKEAGNVFNDLVRVGVGITVAVKSSAHSERKVFYYRVGDYWKAEQKLEYLREMVVKAGRHNALSTVPWQDITPDAKSNWLIPENADEYAGFLPMGTQEAKKASGFVEAETIFKTFGRGVATSRDDLAYDFNREQLITKIQNQIEAYNAEVDRYKRAGRPKDVDSFVKYDVIKWSRDLKLDMVRGNYAMYDAAKVRTSLYRPFNKRYLFFDRVMNEEVYVFPRIFPTPSTEGENRVICVSAVGNSKTFHTLIANVITDLHLTGDSQCFPYYTYDEDGGNRRENITDWALAQFRAHYHDDAISKWDIFYYVYAALHVPNYREKFAANLKKELPRIPYAPDFHAYARAGQQLANLHLNYETVTPYPLAEQWTPNQPPRTAVKDKMRLNRDKTALAVNPSLTLTGIPKAALDYKLGNRSALEWVIDQYQVKTDARSGITSDPNRYSDDPRYIVDLVKRVVQVSLETQQIVAGL